MRGYQTLLRNRQLIRNLRKGGDPKKGAVDAELGRVYDALTEDMRIIAREVDPQKALKIDQANKMYATEKQLIEICKIANMSKMEIENIFFDNWESVPHIEIRNVIDRHER